MRINLNLLQFAKKDALNHSMLERSHHREVNIAAASSPHLRRAALFFFAVALTIAGLLWLAAVALSAGGFGTVDLILTALFAVTLPWYVIGFWNAVIGLLIMRF